MSEYYVYIYLDPRKPGNYEYEELHFTFEPFYVGKGKGNRATAHLREALGNWKPRQTKHHKYNKLRVILDEGLLPIIQKIKEGLSEQEAYMLEERIIKQIGCEDEEKGPLTNILKNNEFGLLPEEARKRSVETRRKNGHYVMSSEQKEKIRQAHLGKTLSDEHKQHILEARKGYRHSEEAKQHIRDGQNRDKASQNTKQSWQNPEVAEKRKVGVAAAYKRKRELGIKYMWVNNGIVSKMLQEDKASILLEQGWVPGRLKINT